MRKHLLFVLLAALCCNGLLAQGFDDDYSDESVIIKDKSIRIAIGPKVGAGIGLGSHSKLENISFSPALSYQAGAAINAHFGRRHEFSDGGTGLFGLEIEALYGKRCVKLGGSTLSVNDIEVPVLAQIYFTPSVALEVGATFVKVLGVTPNRLYYNGATYGTGEISGNDVMITAGFGYKIRAGKSSSMLLDLRYNMGMSNLAGNFDTKVSSVMFSFAYLFNIVK